MGLLGLLAGFFLMLIFGRRFIPIQYASAICLPVGVAGGLAASYVRLAKNKRDGSKTKPETVWQ